MDSGRDASSPPSSQVLEPETSTVSNSWVLVMVEPGVTGPSALDS